jgi:D-amino-acid dehydrogenase
MHQIGVTQAAAARLAHERFMAHADASIGAASGRVAQPSTKTRGGAADADVVIIGAGIIGLACAWSVLQDGARVTVIDPDFEGDRTSHGNAGVIAMADSTPISVPGVWRKVPKWLMDPLGPLSLDWKHLPRALPWFMAFQKASAQERFKTISHALAALHRRTYRDLLPMLNDADATHMLHRRGALLLYETDTAFHADAEAHRFKQGLGAKLRIMTANEVREMEPVLAPVFKHGVFQEECAHVGDPRAIVTLLRERVRALGAHLVTGRAKGIVATESGAAAMLEDGTRVAGGHVVVATGAWSAKLAASVGDPVLLESERGYNTTLPDARIGLSREVVFAERKFVATPLDIGLRIGGAAEFAGLHAPPNYRRSDALLTLGKTFLPGLQDAGAVKWMGHRPSTPDSLPVIGRSPKAASIVYAFGHGHLGLTQSATTGALVADIVAGRTSDVPIAPYSIARFAR